MAALRRILQLAKPGEAARAQGWVSSVRKMKKWAFADITDGSSVEPLSVILTPDQAAKLSTGACVDIRGQVKESPKGATQAVELHADSVKLLGEADSTYPLQKKYHSREFLRQFPQFRWKTRTAAQVLQYRSFAIKQLTDFFNENDVVQVNSPILTSSDCEGAGEVFGLEKSLDFFGKQAYLSVSSQLHLEVYCAALARVWNMTPAFRAEASDTNRHLSEFWMVEAELAFLDSLAELTGFCEQMVKATVPTGSIKHSLLASKRDQEARDRLEQRWETLAGKWTTMTYTDAVDFINAHGTKVSTAKWGDGLSSEQEKFLAGTLGTPVVVTDYPTEIKPFYMKASSSQTVACFDLLIPDVGELVGGSMREDNYEKLLANLEKYDMNPESMSWYTDLRKYGSFPHGGYGLGFERLVMYTCGLDNIRDATGFIRGFGQLPC